MRDKELLEVGAVLLVALLPLERCLAEPRIIERMFWRGRRLETAFCFFMIFVFVMPMSAANFAC